MFKITLTARFLAWKLCAVALFILLGLILCLRLSHPWTYNDDYNGAFWSQAARNLSLNGFLSTAGVPAPLYFGQPPIPADALYVHHPTLLPAMMFIDRRLLGEREWAARCLPILFSLVTAALLWVFVSRSFGYRGATFVLAFFIAAPMELHYGQMVNFEAPELLFLLAALCFYHLWRKGREGSAAAMLLCCVLAMWTDWQGYLLVLFLGTPLLIYGPAHDRKLAATLLLTAILCGIAFLVQIHLAAPTSWHDLFQAFRERSGHSDLSGGSFTPEQWMRTEATYLTSLFNPVQWILAGAGAAFAFFNRKHLSPLEAAPLHIGAILLLIDAVYGCALRNQSFIHDFAWFYLLIPIAVYSGFLVERIIRFTGNRWPGYPGSFSTPACCALAAILVWSGIRSLDGIDTQFCILDDDDTEPPTLMPDLGRLIDRNFPADAVIICNFDRYYSPLPYYARRVMANNAHTSEEWQKALSDALPQSAAGIVWMGAPDATDLLRHLPSAETRRVNVDGVPFVLWQPGPIRSSKDY